MRDKQLNRAGENEKKPNAKKKKSIIIRILLVLAIAVMSWLAINICITLIFTQRIPHRYASIEEGKNLVLSTMSAHKAIPR